MNKAQIAVLAVAVLAGGGAFMIMSRPRRAGADGFPPWSLRSFRR